MLHIIFGPMFSGKTTCLSDVLKNHKEKTLYINHIFDSRGEFFYSHNPNLKFSDNINCIKLNELKDGNITKEYNIIAIDEAQFFTNIKDVILKWIEKDKKIVYIAGLISDYKRELFGEINQLIIYADTISKLTSICKCKKDAIFSKRKNKDEKQILIGSSEYEPVCRECYNL